MTAAFCLCPCSQPVRLCRPSWRYPSDAPSVWQSLKHKGAVGRCRNAAATQRVLASSQHTPESSQAGSSSQQQNKQEDPLLTRQRSQPPALPPQKDDDNLLAGVLEEVNLIEWPKFTQALRDTFVVIGIVGALSVLLFITNSSFTELSRLVYKS